MKCIKSDRTSFLFSYNTIYYKTIFQKIRASFIRSYFYPVFTRVGSVSGFSRRSDPANNPDGCTYCMKGVHGPGVIPYGLMKVGLWISRGPKVKFSIDRIHPGIRLQSGSP